MGQGGGRGGGGRSLFGCSMRDGFLYLPLEVLLSLSAETLSRQGAESSGSGHNGAARAGVGGASGVFGESRTAGGIGVVARKLPQSGLRRGPRRCLVVLGLSGGSALRQKVRGPPSCLHSSLLMMVLHFSSRAFPNRRNRPGAELRGVTQVAFGRGSVPEVHLLFSRARRVRSSGVVAFGCRGVRTPWPCRLPSGVSPGVPLVAQSCM